MREGLLRSAPTFKGTHNDRKVSGRTAEKVAREGNK
jgi:hypothetical protein